MTVEWLPKYTPELNDIEHVWLDLKANHLAHQTFTDLVDLDQAIHNAVTDLARVIHQTPVISFRRADLAGLTAAF